ncbi:MAG: type II secretion system F family protein [Thermofilum sp.]
MSLPYLVGQQLSKLAGEKIKPFREIYRTAGFSETFEEYLGKWGLAFAASTPAVAALSMAFHSSVLGYPAPVSALLTLIILVIYTLLFTMGCLYYPVYRRHSRGWTITARLPHALAHFAVLASSGSTLTEIIREVRDLEESKELRRELDLFLTDVELLGLDVPTAIERGAARSPSAALALFFSGLRDAYITGRSLYEYASFTAQRLLEMRRAELSSVVNALATVAEMYTALIVAAPLMFIVMLSIIGMLGGSVAGLPANLLIAVIVLILVPFSAAAVLVILDSVLSRV